MRWKAPAMAVEHVYHAYRDNVRKACRYAESDVAGTPYSNHLGVRSLSLSEDLSGVCYRSLRLYRPIQKMLFSCFPGALKSAAAR